jgi:eukaryotic-like serine/threonine-protein kinase
MPSQAPKDDEPAAGMKVKLRVTEGPHTGKSFTFDRHDTFLVGRTKDCHFQLSYDDPYFSRRHFLVEVNPPRCRVFDLKSRNGIRVNGEKAEVIDVRDGDQIRAGHTVFAVTVDWPQAAEPMTIAEPVANVAASPAGTTVDFNPTIQVPGYRIESELGRGYMGIVYRAVRESDGLVVALKTIAPAPGVPENQVTRFLREAEILGQLRHPHIVGFVEGGKAGSLIYLAMEYLTGPDVARVLADKGPMKPKIAVRMMCQVLAGLGHAHEQGFVHRDIKPANILLHTVDGKRVAKLADFGLARAFDSSRMSGLTMQGELGGTPAFMAPEQVTHYRDVTPAADQYSIAATLYNLLTGTFPHNLPKNVGQALVVILTEDSVPIRVRRPDIDAGLANAIHCAMSREVENRFLDTLLFREALLPYT